MSINVLLISLDSALAKKEANAAGNTQARQIEYAKHLKNLYIVVKTYKNIKSKVIKIKNNLSIYPTLSLNKYFFLFDAYMIASKICKENKIDLISTQDPFITGLIGWFIKKKYGIPLNIQIAADMIDNQYFIKEGNFNLFLNCLAKRLMQKADSIRVSTIREKEKLILQGIDREKIHYLPFFIDFTSFQQGDGNSIREASLNGRFDKIVLSVNRLVKQKNIKTLIRAVPYIINEYPKCLFLIIGSGREERSLKKLAFNLGVEKFIKFQGPVSYKDIPRYFQAADIFVSTSHYEGTCMAVLEAAAAKKPIISTPHAGACDALKDGYTGFIVDFNDYIGLSKKILYLLENDIISKGMSNNAHTFITGHFKKEEILRKYFDMWGGTKANGKFIK